MKNKQENEQILFELSKDFPRPDTIGIFLTEECLTHMSDINRKENATVRIPINNWRFFCENEIVVIYREQVDVTRRLIATLVTLRILSPGVSNFHQ